MKPTEKQKKKEKKSLHLVCVSSRHHHKRSSSDLGQTGFFYHSLVDTGDMRSLFLITALERKTLKKMLAAELGIFPSKMDEWLRCLWESIGISWPIKRCNEVETTTTPGQTLPMCLPSYIEERGSEINSHLQWCPFVVISNFLFYLSLDVFVFIFWFFYNNIYVVVPLCVFVCVCVYVYVCICMCMCVCLYVYVLCMCLCVCVSMCVLVHVCFCISLCICVCACIYVCMKEGNLYLMMHSKFLYLYVCIVECFYIYVCVYLLLKKPLTGLLLTTNPLS